MEGEYGTRFNIQNKLKYLEMRIKRVKTHLPCYCEFHPYDIREKYSFTTSFSRKDMKANYRSNWQEGNVKW